MTDVALGPGSEPARAVALYEAFLAGCYEKAEELDDSSGSFGTFVGELFCGWVKARQAAGASPEDTATRSLGWIEEDPYGFCFGLEKDLAGVLDKTGLAALVQQVRAARASTTKPRSGTSSGAKHCYAKAGREPEWEQVVSEVRAIHHHKHGFVAGFERIANGVGPDQEPPFLEWAKARWIGPPSNA